MKWFIGVALAALAVCTLLCLGLLIRLIQDGRPKDLAKPKGKPALGIRYSLTGAMSPKKKESAFMHLPTYIAGLIYHFGTFVSLFLLLLSFLNPSYPIAFAWTIAGFLIFTCMSGLGILIKRLTHKALRDLSNLDDYFSNLLVSLFQLSTALVLIAWIPDMVYYLLAAALLLYIPVGKLRHLVYFFSARYQLGWQYGLKGVWK
jgi:hypothetical protein